MKLRYLLIVVLVFASVPFVFAQDDFPEEMFEQGSIALSNPDLVLEIEFDDEDDWLAYEDDTALAEVDTRNEVYEVELEYVEDANYLWIEDTPEYEDVVIQIDTEQTSNELHNGYGILCRSDGNGNGYRFFISGDGWVSIARITEDSFDYIYDWEESEFINQGEDENQLTAVCVEEYLGFYVNGELVAEVEDDTFSEGAVTIAVAIYEEDEDIEIEFDNLLVWEVESAGKQTSRSNTGGGDDVEDLADDVTDALEDGDVEIELDDLLLVETWESAGEWDELDGDGFEIEVDDGVYLLEETAGLLTWGANRTEYDDVVMHVEIEHISDEETNAFGLMCRVDTENVSDGYSFLIRPNGTFAIGYWNDAGYTSLLDEDFEVSSDIDEDDSYEITVVCVDEYLALYVDEELIGEVEDDTFDEGFVAVAAITFDDEVRVEFDNLVIWEGRD